MRNDQLPTTEEEFPQRHAGGPAGEPIFLAAFPRQIAVPIPKTGEVVGRAWIESAGLSDGKVSRQHLCFTRPGGNLSVTDVGSSHGTFVDCYKLERNKPVTLEDGAVLRIGQTILVYREQFDGPNAPLPLLGDLVAPWTLGDIRKKLSALHRDVQKDSRQMATMNILLEGPTGAGKELLAREIARVLGRGGNRFTPVNIAAISHNLFEGHLFGWQKGGFTGAQESNPGVLGGANGGAVFLDELEALPLELQPKLLRYLQDREVFRMGTKTPIYPDTVVIAATNESLREKVGAQTFRRDILGRFLYRFELPSLEDRAEDIFAIFEAVWRYRRRAVDFSTVHVDAEAVELMMGHKWPENVREIERLVLAVDPADGLTLSLVQRELRIPPNAARKRPAPLTREAVEHALKVCSSEAQAAEFLGVSRGKLRPWRKKNGV